MSVSARDLAKVTNVSPATVSMVLNNRPGISEKTRKKVLDAAVSMGYNLKTSKREFQSPPASIHFVIYKKHGVVVSDTPFFSKVIEGIDFQSKKHGYRLQITYFYENQEQSEQLSAIKKAGSAGILLLGTEMDESDLSAFLELQLPIVVLDSYFEFIRCDTVLINNVQGAYIATRKLLDSGHTKIGYLRSRTPINNFKERADGYFKALRSAKISTVDPPYIFRVSPTMEGAYHDMKEILSQSPELPTAFFADNDVIAASCVRALKEYGIRIPEDVSIIGFDNTAMSEILEPPLTTMHVPKERLGALAVDRLISKIKGESDEIVKIEISTQLIERESIITL